MSRRVSTGIEIATGFTNKYIFNTQVLNIYENIMNLIRPILLMSRPQHEFRFLPGKYTVIQQFWFCDYNKYSLKYLAIQNVHNKLSLTKYHIYQNVH